MVAPESLLPGAWGVAAEGTTRRPVNAAYRHRLIAGLAGVLVAGVCLGRMAWPTVERVQGPRVISAGAGPSALAISPDGRTLYVADYGNPDLNATPATGAGDTVTPVDLRTGRPGRPITVGSLPDWLAVGPAHRTLYVLLGPAPGSGDVVPVDLTTGLAGPAMTFPGGAGEPLVSPDQRTLYVAHYLEGGGNVQVVPVDLASGRRGAPVTLPKTMGHLALSPDGTALYGAIQGSEIVSVNLRTGRVAAPIRLGNVPRTLAFSPDGKLLYVLASIWYGPESASGPQDLFVISVASQKVVTSVALNAPPSSIAVAPDGRMVYIQSNDTSITPISTATWHQGATIPAVGLLDALEADLGWGVDGSTLVISPDGRTLYALNGTGVAVIPVTG